MRYSRALMAGLLALFVVVLVAAPATAYRRPELRQYKTKTLTVPDFTLKSTDGKSYSLKDYRDNKMYVILETGSST